LNRFHFEIYYCYAGITIEPGFHPNVKLDFSSNATKKISSECGRPQNSESASKIGVDSRSFCRPLPVGGFGQIEARLRYVSDEELIVIASLLGVSTDALFPDEITKRLRGKQLKPIRTKR